MKLGQILARVALALLPAQASARALSGRPSDWIIPEKRGPLQDIVCHIFDWKFACCSDLEQVTWDEHSLYVHGERIIFWGGEFHPFRCVNASTSSCVEDSSYSQTSCPQSLVGHFPKDQGVRLQWRVPLLRMGITRAQAWIFQRRGSFRLGTLL